MAHDTPDLKPGPTAPRFKTRLTLLFASMSKQFLVIRGFFEEATEVRATRSCLRLSSIHSTTTKEFSPVYSQVLLQLETGSACTTPDIHPTQHHTAPDPDPVCSFTQCNKFQTRLFSHNRLFPNC